MRWTWDSRKNRDNRRNHRLSFETAVLVFDDPHAASCRNPYPDEERWQTLGMVDNVLLLVIHTWSARETAGYPGASSVPERRPHVNGGSMRKRSETALTGNQAAELQALAELPDDRIDTADIPELLDWSEARRGVFYRPAKQQIRPHDGQDSCPISIAGDDTCD